MYGYIYRITDLTNGKCYIGQHKWNKPGIDIEYWGSGTIISKVVKKRKHEGRMDTLLREKLMDCATLEELNYFETYFIEYLNTLSPNGYNLNTGGDVFEVAPEVKQKTSKRMKGNTNGFTKGNVPWIKGKHHTDEWKTNHSKYMKDHPNSGQIQKGETRRKGSHHSETTKAKMTKFPLTRDQLYNLYVKDNLSAAYIARLFGCHTTTIERRLKIYKISKK